MNATLYSTEQARREAVMQRDSKADGQFVFAVITTGIFCRPSCRSRHPLPHNMRFFADAASALAAGFRPCKRCNPAGESRQQQQAAQIARACERLDHSEQPLTVAALAAECAMSQAHFQRLFKQITGLTPHGWYRARRAGRLREALRQGEPVTRAIYQAGFGSASGYYQQANSALGMTGRHYRQQGAAQQIEYAFGHSVLGEILVAATKRGVCALFPGEDQTQLYQQLVAQFPRAVLQPADPQGPLATRLAEILAFTARQRADFPLPLDVQGSAFQLQVWQALQTIPAGETASYQDIARKIGRPRAVRAVAGACAANRLALVIPCHRVVRANGALSGYRWGSELKHQLLAREAQESRQKNAP
ncbi:bifunctional DNA-binding transcriptional regulator/O6-methylguanine-DNA methyltransferase Ada [Shimwellia blattae]|uniref:Regulatory protein of adaptive response n=1 Tax=Shimwellia blattae (strain ATCC 29907 / DSM 4481 / JCM 1650 / NBRC 105725 / CDC 9005-74) TaxID=630626 RepID=I2B7B1_SHIBC|nr:bifunctional DNA-binding transcriptional regulator/O6-methylguanine-DNA methyltransferase Ada [Shimwellia blattae]AFJ46415.1 regulatory protein Ada [Shimwellia blattae DSM 4481 = NBRC 105725]GAB79996.1 transcriptional activator/DNA repair enzyme Ada [Shimwellia blattae DSM 4481 = NBRC 105725]VDY63882.1 Regulatory protein of adaptative response [Shimwellia blattae]VEC22019.1 Regulatory protein of adaptative response [Shimwellia blattae]